MRMNQDERRFDFRKLGLASKQAREEKGWTQAYVAELVDKTDRTIMNIENKGPHPSFNLFFKLVTLFDISVDHFFYTEGQRGENSCRKHGLRQKVSDSTPFCPFAGLTQRCCRIPLCYELLFCTCFSQAYLASIQLVAQKHWRLATRLTGDYLDRTLTGKLITDCRTHDFHPLETCAAGRTMKKGVRLLHQTPVGWFLLPPPKYKNTARLVWAVHCIRLAAQFL